MIRLFLASAVGLGLCVSSPVTAEDWLQFRGPSGSGATKGAALPTEWSADKNVAWKVKLPGTGLSQPVVVGDKLFVAAAVSDKLSKPKSFGPGVIETSWPSVAPVGCRGCTSPPGMNSGGCPGSSRSTRPRPSMATPSTSPTAAGNWLGSRTDPTQMTNIVKALNNPPFASLKESRTLLRRIVLTNSLPPLVREQAIGMLARADLRSETKLLRVVLKGELRGGDFPDVYPNEKDPDRKIAISSDTELRDAALGYAVLQDNLSIRDFGFVTPSGFNPAFKSEEQRSFGYGKWGWKLMKESVALLAKNTKPKKDEPK